MRVVPVVAVDNPVTALADTPVVVDAVVDIAAVGVETHPADIQPPAALVEEEASSLDPSDCSEVVVVAAAVSVQNQVLHDFRRTNCAKDTPGDPTREVVVAAAAVAEIDLVAADAL